MLETLQDSELDWTPDVNDLLRDEIPKTQYAIKAQIQLVYTQMTHSDFLLLSSNATKLHQHF